MIAGLPVQTWLLAAAATVPGLVIAVAFHRAHRGDPGRARSGDGTPRSEPET